MIVEVSPGLEMWVKDPRPGVVKVPALGVPAKVADPGGFGVAMTLCVQLGFRVCRAKWKPGTEVVLAGRQVVVRLGEQGKLYQPTQGDMVATDWLICGGQDG